MAVEFLQRMGERLRARREEMGLSRSEVARLMPGKVNENQIYRWEKGQHQPNPDTLEALAQVLERDVAYFMAPEPAKVETPDLSRNGNGSQLDRIEHRLELIEGRLEELTSRDAALTEHDRELLSRFEEMVQRLGRDIGRGQPQSRGARG